MSRVERAEKTEWSARRDRYEDDERNQNAPALMHSARQSFREQHVAFGRGAQNEVPQVVAPVESNNIYIRR